MTFATIIDDLKRREKYTPDFSLLKKFEYLPVFLYDEFRRYKEKDFILKNLGAKYLGEGKTATNTFIMKNLEYPIVFHNNPSSFLSGFIRGDVYALSPKAVLALDKYKLNGYAFKRESRNIQLIDQTAKIKSVDKSPILQCFMYIGDPVWWKDFDLRTNVSYHGVSGSKWAGKYYEYLSGRSSNYYNNRHNNYHQHSLI